MSTTSLPCFAPPPAAKHDHSLSRGFVLDVLLVADDNASRDTLTTWIGRQGMSCRTATGLEGATAHLARRKPDFTLLDLELSAGRSLELLAVLRSLSDSQLALISSEAGSEDSIGARHVGSRCVLGRPVALPRLAAMLQDCTASVARRHASRRRRDELHDTGCFGALVGVSSAMQDVYTTIERVAPTDATVFVLGATGTGKELAATMVHRLSRRAAGPFIALNCGAVPANLIESELFGHERGAFTGADRQHKGVFEQASGGTLFLDEVTEMAPDLQVRLLRVLESGELVRVGGSTPVEIDVRIVAASNRDPQSAVHAGTLRQDLLYRLYVVPLLMPRLGERGQDISLLATRFLAQLNDEHGTAKVFAPGVAQRLAARSWPGNVRELRNAVHRAWIMSDDVIDIDALATDEDTLSPAPVGEPFKLRPGMSIREVERQLIETTLVHVNGDKHAASDLLGISVKTLYSRLSVYAATSRA